MSEAGVLVLGLTTRQQECLQAIEQHTRAHDWPPTRVELARALKVTPNAVTCLLKALEKKHAIALSPGVSRGIRILI